MTERQPISPRRRLQELQAIPERERTDEQWDELNELEIALASANRVDGQDRNGGGGGRRNAPAAGDQPKPGGGAQAKKPFKKFPKRPPKANPPQGSSGA